MWVFDKCCGCIELRTGCLIIGYMQLVTQAISTIEIIIGVVAGTLLMNKSDEETRKTGLLLVIAFVIFLLFLIPFLAVTITFVVGLHKNKPGHVKIYLIYSLVFLVQYLVLTITGLAAGTVSIASIIQQVVYILLNIYYLLVIQSYWLQMKNGNIHPTV